MWVQSSACSEVHHLGSGRVRLTIRFAADVSAFSGVPRDRAGRAVRGGWTTGCPAAREQAQGARVSRVECPGAGGDSLTEEPPVPLVLSGTGAVRSWWGCALVAVWSPWKLCEFSNYVSSVSLLSSHLPIRLLIPSVFIERVGRDSS